MATFTAPTDRVDGATESAADFNTDVLDNIRELIQHDADYTDYDEGTDKTTTSTSFAAIDTAGGTDLRGTYTVEAGEDVHVVFFGLIHGVNSGNAAGGVYLNLLIDGTTTFFGDDGVCVLYSSSLTAALGDVLGFLFARVTGLTNASHTFDITWKVTAASSTTTGTLYAGAGTTRQDTRPQLWVFKA